VTATVTDQTALSYVLPLRWEQDQGRLDELTSYLRGLSTRCQLIVVDGSPQAVFDRHARAWSGIAEHYPPDPDQRFLNGKVNGVITGVRRAVAEVVVIADDDVRYDPDGLAAVGDALHGADLVIPQNVFSSWPWHARWDTARSLLNRSFGTDYPGTLAIRRSTFERCGGYDGNVLFENLELIRTVVAHGGQVRPAPHLFIRRLTPSATGFWSQRVRQAYDSLGQPPRLAAELAVLPALSLLAQRTRARGVAAAALIAVAISEAGRRRAGGSAMYPATAALWAPLWILERGACSWLALWQRAAHGGIRYSGNRITVAAHSTRSLQARAFRPVTGPEPRRRGHGTAPGHVVRRRTA
jgi:glycosyl transferase family 21